MSKELAVTAEMSSKFIVYGRLSGLNEYIKANRANKYAGNEMKRKNENLISLYINQFKVKKVDKYPVKLKIAWYEPNRRRDVDNITFATKFIQDALVKSGVLKNDSQSCIDDVEHHVYVDKDNARVEVEIIEK